MTSVDLNADLGERPDDGAGDGSMLEVVTSASIACGFHAGDPLIMHRTVQQAVDHGVVVGAHPSYDDRKNFGREVRQVDPSRLTDELLYQIGALDAIARRSGTRVRYVKPHGALYNQMAEDRSVAGAVCECVKIYGGLTLLAPAGTVAIHVALEAGVQVASEVFADRAYRPDGRLVERTQAKSLITDPAEAAKRAVRLATEKRVRTIEGGDIELEGSSICVHGDTPGAHSIASRVRSELERAGIEVSPFVS